MAILVVESSEVWLFFVFVCGPNKCCGNMKRVFIQLRATCSLVELVREGCGGGAGRVLNGSNALEMAVPEAAAVAKEIFG